MIRIALDTMGGDYGPQAMVAGAKLAVERGLVAAEQLLLVGADAAVRAELDAQGLAQAGFEIVNAPDALEGGESPVEALKRKPHNSVAVGIGQLKAGRAHGFVSAGNTGLVVASAMFGLSCLEGIRRPGIAVTIRGEKGPFTVMDVGANPQPKPQHLLHYGLMGAAYMRDTFGIERPRVGLMNIGSEDKKGNPLVREALEMLQAVSGDFEFVGNVEGVDVFAGKCDVIVSDGFTGNVLLKVSEGCAEYLLRSMGRAMAKAGVDSDLQKQVLGSLMRDVDFSEYGGALLLGVEGIVTICHGRSNASAIANAIGVASRAVGAKVNEHIVHAARQATTAS